MFQRLWIVLFSLSCLSLHAFASSATITLSQAELSWIAQRIYANEAHQNPKYLTHWNQGEAFPSFGIGHFIWYPENVPKTFVETFPAMVRFVSQKATHPVLPPVWLQTLRPFSAPWKTKIKFDQAWAKKPLVDLRAWLASTQTQQAEFIYDGFKVRWQTAMLGFSKARRVKLNRVLKGLTDFKAGRFAVLDYFNFKGMGHNVKEQYQQQGWGLIEVLQHLTEEKNFFSQSNQVKLEAFIQAAKVKLQQRIQNAPPIRQERRWRNGWFNRLEGYRIP